METEPRTERRTFLARAAIAVGAAAGAALPSIPAAAKTRKRRIHKLDPEWGRVLDSCRPKPHQRGPDCHGCRACHNHAKNKLYSSAKAAKRPKLRAHKHCKCMPKKGPRIDAKTWKKLFVKKNGSIRPYVDKRDPRVQRILGI